MSWNAPPTAVAGGTVSSADFNTYVRDNLAETMPSLASAPGSMFAVDGANSIAERLADTDLVFTSETTTSTSYTDLATPGPTVTVFTGPFAIVIIGGRLGGNTTPTTNATRMSWAITGATTRAASDTWAAGLVGYSATGSAFYTSRWYFAGVTPGANVFTAKYAVTGGTGTFAARSLAVIPL